MTAGDAKAFRVAIDFLHFKFVWTTRSRNGECGDLQGLLFPSNSRNIWELVSVGGLPHRPIA